MMRLSSLLAAAAVMLVASVMGETIVSDNVGTTVGLPLLGGVSTSVTVNTGTTTPFPGNAYKLQVYINDISPENEFFFINKPNNGTFYGNAVFLNSYFSPDPTHANNIGNMVLPPASIFGNATNPLATKGLYTFFFLVPGGGNVSVQLTYNQTAAGTEGDGTPIVPVSDLVSITITNPLGVVGDPQFVGLRGQSYQVHGIDGAVYNLISSKSTQVNSRFAFLSEGECPVVDGVVHSNNCWSHPGSYLGEMSFQQKVDGKIHSALIQAGSAKKGFAMIQVDGQVLAVGDRKAFGSFSIERTSTHHVSITTEEFNFELDNSDMFINQAVAATVPLSQLKAHGLLGQTHAAKVYPTSVRYIAGEVDDYVIADDNLFGTDFVHNQF